MHDPCRRPRCKEWFPRRCMSTWICPQKSHLLCTFWVEKCSNSRESSRRPSQAFAPASETRMLSSFRVFCGRQEVSCLLTFNTLQYMKMSENSTQYRFNIVPFDAYLNSMPSLMNFLLTLFIMFGWRPASEFWMFNIFWMFSWSSTHEFMCSMLSSICLTDSWMSLKSLSAGDVYKRTCWSSRRYLGTRWMGVMRSELSFVWTSGRDSFFSRNCRNGMFFVVRVCKIVLSWNSVFSLSYVFLTCSNIIEFL